MLRDACATIVPPSFLPLSVMPANPTAAQWTVRVSDEKLLFEFLPEHLTDSPVTYS